MFNRGLGFIFTCFMGLGVVSPSLALAQSYVPTHAKIAPSSKYFPEPAKMASSFRHLMKLGLFDNNSRSKVGANVVEIAPTDVELTVLINSALENFSRTNLGMNMLIWILDCDAAEIEKHLGASPVLATQLAQRCSAERATTPKHRSVYPGSPDRIRKMGPIDGFQKRTYSLVFIEKCNFARGGLFNIDSWTHIDRTYIIICKNDWENATDGEFVRYINQTVAHEQFFYFDSKFWACGRDWANVQPLNLVYSSYAHKPVCTAMNNPIIAQIMAYIRAFKGEMETITELENKGLVIKARSTEYRGKAYEFLTEKECNSECLKAYIQREAHAFYPIALSLLAYAPFYRSDKAVLIRTWQGELRDQRFSSLDPSAQFNSNSTSESLEVSAFWRLFQTFIKVLEDHPTVFYDEIRSEGDAFLSILEPSSMFLSSEKLMRASNETAQIFRDHFVPQDLEILIKGEVETEGAFGSRGQRQKIIDFFADPLWSSFNLPIVFGARVRIRTTAEGGGQR